MSADALAEQLAHLQEENASLRAQLGEPDLKAFEQIKELRSTNKRLTDEVKRLTTEGVHLAFKNRQLDQQARKFQQESAESITRLQEELAETVAKLNHELAEAVARSQRLDHSVEELQGELIKSREQMLSHEAELERQKEELAQRQQNMTQLQDELSTREGRISKLEQMVNDFKEQFLSGDDFEAVAAQQAAEGPAYQLLMSHIDLALGMPGRTLVDQVYELLEMDKNCQDIQRLEELFDTLQDTGSQVFTEEHDQVALKQALGAAWEAVQGGSTSPAPAAAAVEAARQPEPVSPPVPVVQVTPPSTLSLGPPPPLDEPEPGESEPVAIEPEPEPVEPEPEPEVVEPEPVAVEPEHEPEAVQPVSVPIEPSPAMIAPEPEPDLSTLLDLHDEEEAAAAESSALEATMGSLGIDLSLEPEPEPTEPEVPPLDLAALLDEMHVDEPVESETVPESSEWLPPAAKAKYNQIAEALPQVSSQPSLALEMLDQALEVEVWVENEARANLAVARLKANQQDIVPYLNEALGGIELGDLFPLLSAAESTASGTVAERLGLFYQFGTTPRAEMVKQEGAVGLGKRSLNRDFVSQIGNEDEEEVVNFLRDNLIPKAGLQLPVPSKRFEERLESTGPAAFVGTLRQALRAVDYTLFEFPELRVLTYDGPEHFLVDASAEPDLTLVFHRDIEGMPPEELCFLVFRHLVRMYRGHSQLAHQSSALDNAQRLQLAKAAVELYLEEGSAPHATLMDRLQALQADQTDFEAECRSLMLHWYQATNWAGFLYTREFAFQDEVFRKRLDPVADHAAARLVGITAATYGSLREELLSQPQLLEEVQEGLNELFEHTPGISSTRLRIQRMWNEFLLEE